MDLPTHLPTYTPTHHRRRRCRRRRQCWGESESEVKWRDVTGGTGRNVTGRDGTGRHVTCSVV